MNSVFKTILALGAFSSLLALISLAASATVLTNPWLILTAIFISWGSAIRPAAAISVFLFLLPVFGNKPGTSQAHYLLVAGSCLQLGASFSVLKKWRPESRYEALLPSLTYLLVSFLSLFPVSAATFWGWFKSSQPILADFSMLSWNISSILTAREDEASYPVLTVFWTVLSFSLSIIICRICSCKPENMLKFCWSLFAGLLISMIAGIMNYYNFLDLSSIRELDPVVNPGGRQYRLQSWFGHSGWYAEYVTMLAPLSLLLLTVSASFWKRVVFIVLILLAGEIVLILTFQRGGWLSYPLTLLAVWASIYTIRHMDRGTPDIIRAARSSAIKILLSLPLTLLISFLIIKSFGSQFGIDQYADRLKDIAKASDRLDFVKAGIMLGSINPVLGSGSESFAISYRREFRQQDGKFYAAIDLPLHGTAHNLYAQTFAGKGSAGLIFLLVMLFSSATRGIRFILSPESSSSRKLQIIALASSCSITAVFIYGFVQEFFYVQTLQYVLFAMVGISASLPLNSRCQFPTAKNWGHTLLIIIFFIFPLHLLISKNSSRPYSDSSGCYAEESGDNESWRWCGARSSIDIPESMLGQELTIESAPAQKDTANKHLITIESCNSQILSRELSASGRLQFSLPADQLKCAQPKPGYIRLQVSYGNHYIPALESDSSDRRVISFRWIWQNNKP